jgi:uncharacterized protein
MHSQSSKDLAAKMIKIQVANQSMTLQMFHPFDQLALKLLAASADDEDGAHDLSHIVRVWRNAKLIQREKGGDLEVLAAAALLHHCIQVAKDSPLRSKASLLAANESRHAHRGAGVEG